MFRDESRDGGYQPRKYRRTYTWNSRNQLVSSVDANYSTSYVYGQDGQRSNKYTQGSETLYFNKMWTLHTDSGNSTYGGQYAKNVYLGETRIVTKLTRADQKTAHEEMYKQYFYHSDHLGSASMISDWEGKEYQRIEYTPYGETWVEKTSNSGSEFLPYKFTGKEVDQETGLYYYGARYLDPKYSMWISTDPALGEYIPEMGKGNSKNSANLPGMGGVYNHINFNLYHYAGNNPVRYLDPDGREDEFDWIDRYVPPEHRESVRKYTEENKKVQGGTLSVKEIAAIVFNETRSLSGAKIDQARKEIAHAIINADKKWGEKRDKLAGTAPKTANPPDVEKATYNECMKIAKDSVKEDEEGTDPTNGAFFFNFRKTDSTSDFQGKRNHTSTGPLDNSFSDYKYADTYGD